MFKPCLTSITINRGIIAKTRRTAGGRASGVPKVPRPADRCAAGGGSVAWLETGDTILYEKRLVPGIWYSLYLFWYLE